MKILILEGIATSGKTSVRKRLEESLAAEGVSFTVVSENETLMPILNNGDRRVAIAFLKDVINKALAQKRDVVIFDRLYFTYILRTNSSVEDFKEIEDMLQARTLLALLDIDESRIPERIAYARRHREQRWNEYVSKKGSDGEIVQYYIDQQRRLKNLVTQTSLNNRTDDTSDLDFDRVANTIMEELFGT